MASTLGGNKAVSVQERIKQLIEQGVPLTEATDQAHREAVAATELMFPTTEGDRPPPGVTTAATFGDAPLSGVTTAATFGDGSTGISARPSPYFQLGEKIDVQSHSDWMKARRQALDELNRKYDASAEQSPSQTAPVDDSSDRLEGVSAEAKQEILEAGGEVTPSVDVEERPTDPIRAGDPPEDAEREFAGAGISDPTLALDDFYPEMTDVDQQALVRALLSEGQQPTGIALPEQAGGQRIPRLLELLGGIGGQIAQSRAIGSSNRANAARQARANLQSALRGGGGGAAFQETPKVGLLGHLATGLKGLGTGLQDVRTDDVTAEQTDFENRLALAKAATERISASRQTSAHRPTAAQNKVAMMQLGRDLHEDGLDRDAIRDAVTQDPSYLALVAQNPNMAAEMVGYALQGFDERVDVLYERNLDEKETAYDRESQAPGVSATEERVLDPIGSRMFDNSGELYGTLNRENAERAVREAFPSMAEGEISGAVDVVIDSFNEARQDARKELYDVVTDMTTKNFRSPAATMSVLDARLAVLPYYIPEEISKQIVLGVEAAANAPKLGVAERSRFSRITSVRSGLRQVTDRIRSNPELFSFTTARLNAIKGALNNRLLPPEVIRTMTQLGFSREVLLRAFTGAAAPESEYQRFMSDFVGKMTDGAEALETQLTTLDKSLYDQQQAILEAAKPVPSAAPPLADDEDESVVDTYAKKIVEYLLGEK